MVSGIQLKWYYGVIVIWNDVELENFSLWNAQHKLLKCDCTFCTFALFGWSH